MATPNPQTSSTVFQALGYAWQFGYTIAIPLVLFALGGRLLDRQFGTHPWLLITGIILSMIISSVALILRATAIMRKVSGTPAASPKSSHDHLPRS